MRWVGSRHHPVRDLGECSSAGFENVLGAVNLPARRVGKEHSCLGRERAFSRTIAACPVEELHFRAGVYLLRIALIKSLWRKYVCQEVPSQTILRLAMIRIPGLVQAF